MNGTITYGEPESEYFRRDLAEASNSSLKVIGEKSPMHYLHYMTAPEDETETAAKVFGRAYHKATLEPESFASMYTVLPADAPARPTKAMLNAKKPSPDSIIRQDWWAQWDSQNAGKIALPAKSMDTIRGMADTQRAHILELPDNNGKVVHIRGAELFDMCKREVTLRWVDQRTGIRCKARLDLLCAELDFGGDLKSCEDASANGFARASANYLYHQQDAHYSDGMQQCGLNAHNFLFFASEKAPPHVPQVFQMPAPAQERGRALRDHALDKLKRCLDTGTWPPYSSNIAPVLLPPWAFYDAANPTD